MYEFDELDKQLKQPTIGDALGQLPADSKPKPSKVPLIDAPDWKAGVRVSVFERLMLFLRTNIVPVVIIAAKVVGLDLSPLKFGVANMLAGKSWKTTSAGIVLIVGGAIRLYFAIKSGALTEEAITTSLTGILTGIGLMFARDNDKTSEQVNAGQ